MLYIVNFKFHFDIIQNQQHALIIDIPKFVEETKDILEKEGLIQTIIEKQIKQRITLFRYEPLTAEHTL